MRVSNYLKNKGFLLKNKIVLYGLLVVAIFNILGYLYAKNYDALILFMAVGYLSTFFTKNMVINLGLPVIVTMFVSGRRTIEGLKNKEDMEDEQEGMENGSDDEQEGMENGSDDEQEGMEHSKGSGNGKKGKHSKKESMKGKKGKKGKKKSGFTNNKLNPASLEDGSSGSRKPNNNYVDHSSTLEGAYDNLEKILGKGGIDGLTNETAALVEQQKKLMSTMNSMEPLLKNANNVLDGIDISKMSGAMESIANVMGGLKIPGMSGLKLPGMGNSKKDE